MDLINRSKAVRKLHEIYDDIQYKLTYENGETLANEIIHTEKVWLDNTLKWYEL